MIQFLSEKGANLNSRDRRGYSPLAIAAGPAPRGGDSASRFMKARWGCWLSWEPNL